MRNAFLTFVLLLVAGVAAAATPRDALLVDAAWLKQHLHDRNLVLLQVGDQESFDAGHIAGARGITLKDVSAGDGSGSALSLEMPNAAELREKLEALGISDDSRVVVLFGTDWVTPSTRVLFTLQYAGLGAHASLLDGGLPAWVRAGGAVTKEPTPAKRGKLAPLALQPIVVDAATVRARLGTPGYAIVDGRAAAFYDGVDHGMNRDGSMHRPGHIHGAHSIPFTSITNDDLTVKSTAELRALFDRAGVKPHDTVIGYCHVGMQTTAMLLAARILDHPVLLYDGSYQDWSGHADYPVDNPSEGRAK